LVIFIVSYDYLDNKLQGLLIDENVHEVTRVIDGDTIVIENKTSVRLLGINTPERGEKYYNEAKDFLNESLFGKQVRLVFVGSKYDKYERLLAYVYLGNENINVELVKRGFGNYYFYSGKDKYSNVLIRAWETCLNENVNLCKASVDKCALCISLKESSLKNNCDFICDLNGWEVKGEGRDKIILTETLAPGEEVEFNANELDLENSGGSLFLRDDEGKLVEYRKI
jgi:micrococcal nuclease